MLGSYALFSTLEGVGELKVSDCMCRLPIGGAAVAFVAVLHCGLGSPEKAAQRAPAQQAW